MFSPAAMALHGAVELSWLRLCWSAQSEAVCQGFASSRFNQEKLFNTFKLQQRFNIPLK